MAKIETLTEYQQSQIIPHREQWLNYLLSCQNSIDKEKAKKGIEWLYKFCKKEPPIIIFMDSPYGCQVAANFFTQLLKQSRDNIWDNIRANIVDNIVDNIRANIRDNIVDNIRANIRANIVDNIWDNIRDNIVDNIWDNIVDNIRDNIWDNIRDNIWDNIWANIVDNIRDNIWDNIWDNIVDNKLEYQNTSYYGNTGDYGWVAWVDYYFKMKLINSDKEADFNSFKELILSGVFEMIQFENICFVSNLPTELHRDNTGRLHNASGSSVKFKDEYFQNHIHGVYINHNLFQKLLSKEYTFQDWVKEGNEEIKSAVLSFMEEKWGSEYLFRFISDNLKESDTYTDKKPEEYLEGTTGGMNIGVYTLFKGQLNNISLAFVRCYCPSTDRMFFLSVDPVHNNAKDAIASLYRVPKKLKGEIKYIQRQGERFSTVFTDNGNSILSSITKEEIENLITISGKEYFSKMKYEY